MSTGSSCTRKYREQPNKRGSESREAPAICLFPVYLCICLARTLTVAPRERLEGQPDERSAQCSDSHAHSRLRSAKLHFITSLFLRLLQARLLARGSRETMSTAARHESGLRAICVCVCVCVCARRGPAAHLTPSSLGAAAIGLIRGESRPDRAHSLGATVSCPATGRLKQWPRTRSRANPLRPTRFCTTRDKLPDHQS